MEERLAPRSLAPEPGLHTHLAQGCREDEICPNQEANPHETFAVVITVVVVIIIICPTDGSLPQWSLFPSVAGESRQDIALIPSLTLPIHELPNFPKSLAPPFPLSHGRVTGRTETCLLAWLPHSHSRDLPQELIHSCVPPLPWLPRALRVSPTLPLRAAWPWP